VKVEVLYVADCPSHPAAVKLVRDVLAAEGITTEVYEVLVRDEQMAGELKFLGSPTIRMMDGMSLENQRRQRISLLAAACTLDPTRLVSRQRRWFIGLC
jgi:hypothetical protein